MKKKIIIIVLILVIISAGVFGFIKFNNYRNEKADRESQERDKKIETEITEIASYKLQGKYSLQDDYDLVCNDASLDKLYQACLKSIVLEKIDYIDSESRSVTLKMLDWNEVLKKCEESDTELQLMYSGLFNDRATARNSILDYITNIVGGIKSTKKVNVDIKLLKEKKGYTVDKSLYDAIDKNLLSSKEYFKTIDYLNSVIGATLINSYEWGSLARNKINYVEPHGMGTQDDKSSLDNYVDTFYVQEKSQTPIKVSVADIMTGQDAVEYVNNIDNRNRGVTNNLTLDLIVVKYDVVNMGKKNIKVTDKFAIVDTLGNISKNSGELFGVTTTQEIEPQKEARLVMYKFSTSMKGKSLVWGSDFNRKIPYAWFDCLDNFEEKVNEGGHISENELLNPNN